MKNAHFGWKLLLVLSVALCTSLQTSANENSATESITAEPTQVEYFNSTSFDKKLSAVMRNKEPAIQLTFPTPFTTNEIPERIDKWLTVVEDYGGTVEVVPEEVERGLLSSLIATLVRRVFEKIKEKRLYGPAKNYDATVYYETRTGVVTRIIFSKKGSNPSAKQALPAEQ